MKPVNLNNPRSVLITQEIRDRFSAKMTGKKRDPIVGRRISAAKKGKKQSPEHIAARVAKNIGQKRTPEQCERIKVMRWGTANNATVSA